MESKEFYFVPTDLYGVYPPRKCIVERVFRTDHNRIVVLVSVEPPIPKTVYRTRHPVSQLVIWVRGEVPYSIINIPEEKWPEYVDIGLLLVNKKESDNVFLEKEAKFIDIGNIFLSKDEADNRFQAVLRSAEASKRKK